MMKSKNKKSIIKSSVRKYIAIDLGSSSTKVFIKTKGLIFHEATLIAYDVDSNKIVAIGNAARNLINRVGSNIKIISPLKHGAITSIEYTKLFIKKIFTLKGYRNVWRNALVLVACPVSVTDLERKALEEMCQKLGAKFTMIDDDIKLGLAGCGYDVYDTVGHMLVDMGSGKTTVGVVSAGKTFFSKTILNGGDHLDNNIKKFLHSNYNLIVSSPTAERIKISLGSLNQDYNNKEILIYGRDVTTRMPKEVYVSGKDINLILVNSFKPIISLIAEILSTIPAEIVKDVITSGINIVGGVSKLRGIKDFLKECFKINIIIPKDSETATLNGAASFESKVLNTYNGIYNNLSLSEDLTEKK